MRRFIVIILGIAISLYFWSDTNQLWRDLAYNPLPESARDAELAIKFAYYLVYVALAAFFKFGLGLLAAWGLVHLVEKKLLRLNP